MCFWPSRRLWKEECRPGPAATAAGETRKGPVGQTGKRTHKWWKPTLFFQGFFLRDSHAWGPLYLQFLQQSQYCIPGVPCFFIPAITPPSHLWSGSRSPLWSRRHIGILLLTDWNKVGGPRPPELSEAASASRTPRASNTVVASPKPRLARLAECS